MSVPPDTSFLHQQSHLQQKVKVVAGYALQQRLGSGSFATVYKGVRVPTSTSPPDTSFAPSDASSSDAESSVSTIDENPETVAIKAITRTSEKLTKKVLQNLEIEISILRTYRHPNIVCMHNVQKTDRHFYLILEYCAGGDVQRLIRTRKLGRLTERLARRLMRDLGAGLRFLWGQELIHRDIKPQNLLLTGPLPLDELHDPESTPEGEAKRRETNFPSAQFSLKIADFGFARHLQAASLAETLCGSPLYMAPEILQHHRYEN
jgi:serine/threonine-protein kinase ULK2